MMTSNRDFQSWGLVTADANEFSREFPSLSGNQPQHNQSTWGAAGTRNIGPSNNMRLQQSTGLSAQHTQQQQQDELFNSSSQLPNNQGGFRFGAQNNINQS